MKTGFDGLNKLDFWEKVFYINEILFGACFLSLLPNVCSQVDGDTKIGFIVFFSVFFPIFTLIFLKDIFDVMEKYVKGDKVTNVMRFIFINIAVIKFIIMALKQ